MTAPATTEEDFDFRRGGTQAEAKQEADAAARRAARSTEYLSSLLREKGDEVIIRFITDEPQWIEVMQHGFIPTKNPPADKPAEAGWPEVTSAVCRYTENKHGEKYYPDCYICEHMRDGKGQRYSRGLRMWALACIRKEVLGTQEMLAAGQIQPYQVNTPVGLVDDIVEYEELKDGKPTGVKLKKKRIVVVNFALQNFFSQFVNYKHSYHTVLDRDYKIRRKGEDRKVDYPAAPMDVINKQIYNEQGVIIGSEPFDLRNPKFAELYADHGINLAQMVKYRMSDEYYGRYFDPRVTVPWKTGGDDEDGDTGGSATTSRSTGTVSEPTDAVTAEQLAAMRDKIIANSRGAEPPQTPPATAEAATEPPAAAAAPETPATASAPSTGPLMDFS